MHSRPETEARLITAARKVIVESGFEGCTLERICSAAGFTRGAFYSNFADKEALFTLVVKDEYSRLISLLSTVTDEWINEILGIEDLSQPQAIPEEQAMAKVGVFLMLTREKIGLDREFLVLHNELLARAAREPQWALQFMEFNRDFVVGVGNAMELMLNHVGRDLIKRPEAVAQAVIGITMRYTGVSVWKDELAEADTSHSPRGTMLELEDIVDLVLTLLQASSRPMRNQS